MPHDPTTAPAPPEFPQPTMITGDATGLATYDMGGHGRDAVFVHANGFCAAVWAPLMEQLHPWHRVAFDMRAHGASEDPGTEAMAWAHHGADTLAVLDCLTLRRPVGIGHSMGAAALLLAEQARPGTFAALWLFEPIVFPPEFLDGTANPLAEGALRRRRGFASPEEAYANFASKPPMQELSPASLAAYVHHGFRPDPDTGGITLCCTPESEAAGYEHGPHHDAWEHLGAVDCPAVVVRGADVGIGPAGIAPMIAERLGRGELEDHPELGHFGPLHDPTAAANSIRAFVQRNLD